MITRRLTHHLLLLGIAFGTTSGVMSAALPLVANAGVVTLTVSSSIERGRDQDTQRASAPVLKLHLLNSGTDPASDVVLVWAPLAPGTEPERAVPITPTLAPQGVLEPRVPLSAAVVREGDLVRFWITYKDGLGVSQSAPQLAFLSALTPERALSRSLGNANGMDGLESQVDTDRLTRVALRFENRLEIPLTITRLAAHGPLEIDTTVTPARSLPVTLAPGEPLYFTAELRNRASFWGASYGGFLLLETSGPGERAPQWQSLPWRMWIASPQIDLRSIYWAAVSLLAACMAWQLLAHRRALATSEEPPA